MFQITDSGSVQHEALVDRKRKERDDTISGMYYTKGAWCTIVPLFHGSSFMISCSNISVVPPVPQNI